MSTSDSVPVEVTWYTPEEGGRQSGPPPGPTYTPTGRFADQPLGEMFSVVLHITPQPAQADPRHATGVLTPGFPENMPHFARRFEGGERFILHEGRRAVAECVMTARVPAEPSV